MKSILKLINSNKGLTLTELLVAIGIVGAMGFYVAEFRRNKLSSDMKLDEMNSIEDYSSNFLRIIEFNPTTNPQNNLCYALFNGLNSNLSESDTSPEHSFPTGGDDILRIQPQHLDTLTGDKDFFNIMPSGIYGFGHFRLEYLELSSGEAGVDGMVRINPTGSSYFEDIFRGSVRFVFTNLKTGREVKTRNKTLIFGYGSDGEELISCSGPSKLDLSLLGRCEIWGEYSMVRNGRCVIPRHRGPSTGMGPTDRVDWTDSTQIDRSLTARETICDLQRRSGVVEGSLCD